MKAVKVKQSTKKLKKLLDKIHELGDTQNVPVEDLKKLDRELDKDPGRVPPVGEPAPPRAFRVLRRLR